MDGLHGRVRGCACACACGCGGVRACTSLIICVTALRGFLAALPLLLLARLLASALACSPSPSLLASLRPKWLATSPLTSTTRRHAIAIARFRGW